MTTRSRIRTILCLIALSASPSAGGSLAAASEHWADFSKGTARSNMHVTLNGCDYNPGYGGSLRMLYPNKSYLKAQFHLNGKPARAALVLDHQSSIDVNAPRRGSSPITIEVNGARVFRDYDPDHGYNKERFSIGRYLRSGWNTIRICYGNGTTHYWLRKMGVETN